MNILGWGCASHHSLFAVVKEAPIKDTTLSQKIVLFTDLRHIRCGDLEWFSPEGELLPVVRPPLPQTESHAELGYQPRGIRLAAQPGTKTGPLEQPPPGKVIYEDGMYRSWNVVWEVPPNADASTFYSTPPSAVTVRYAESDDGFAWRTVADSPLETAGLTGLDGPTFLIDPHAPADERYKVVFGARPPQGDMAALWAAYQQLHPRYHEPRIYENNLHCLYAAVSPDGLNWKMLPEPLMVHQSDTDTTVYWDAWLGRYVLYTRMYWQERRWIGRAESDDFRTWSGIDPMVWPELSWTPTTDIYLNARSEYPGAPQYHLMFPMLYDRFTQASEVHMYSSSDGIVWFRLPGGPVITPGEIGSWDSEFIAAGRDLVPFGPERVAVPYHGTAFPHKYPRWQNVHDSNRVGWVWWQKGRLSSVVADAEGEFFTFPMVPAGRSLRLNVRTRGGGEVRVSVIKSRQTGDSRFHIRDIYSRREVAPGRGLSDCAAITGDRLSAVVSWQGNSDIGSAEGEPVTLHFKLRAAEIFGFEWE